MLIHLLCLLLEGKRDITYKYIHSEHAYIKVSYNGYEID